MSAQDARYPPPPTLPDLAAQIPCSHGSGCPLGVDVPALVRAIRRGDHPRAFLIARASNPFASTCGHGCHAPCETACRRSKFGAPVAIGALERFASGFSIPSLLASPEPCVSPHDARSVAALVRRSLDEAAARGARSQRSVAIVGAGVTGMACAHDLALLGHRAVVFDRAASAGGVLAGPLLAHRVPAGAIAAECAAIEALGAELRLTQALDAPDTIDRLLAEGFDAVFLAIGAHAPAEPLFPRDESAGVHDATELDAEPLRAAGGIVVCGEGALALDAAMALVRQRESPEGRVVHLVLERADAAPSLAMLSAARRSGVMMHIGWTPARILRATDDDSITGLELMSEDEQSVIVLACERIVTAARRSPRAPFLESLARTSDGSVAADAETLRTSRARVWAGGACAFGHRAIAHAIADGKRAAWSIHATLTATRVRPMATGAWVELEEEPGDEAAVALATRRVVLPIFDAPPADPFSSEVTGNFEETGVEASRCFDCSVTPAILEACTGCGKCIVACPTSALRLEGDPRRAVLEQDRCTRCAACVPACPEGAIALVRAVWENRLALEPEPSTMLGLLDQPRQLALPRA